MLPTEILHRILHASLEPNLIHTCRRLYQRLPSYIAYIKTLLLLAYAPRKWSWSATHIAPFKLPVPEMGYLSQTSQRELQIQISGSRWLSTALILETFIMVYEHVIASALLSGEMPLSRAEEDQVRTAIWNIRHHHSGGHFIIRIPPLGCPILARGSVRVSVSADQERLLDMSKSPNQSVRMFVYESIPDCILSNPLDAISLFVLQGFSRFVGWDTSLAASAMEQGILRTLNEPCSVTDNSIVLYTLCKLNNASDSPVPVTIEMLEGAIRGDNGNNDHCLEILLRNLPGWPLGVFETRGLCHVSIQDLLELEMSLESPSQQGCWAHLGRALDLPIFKDAIVDEVARKLGFTFVEELQAARERVGLLVNANRDTPEMQNK